VTVFGAGFSTYNNTVHFGNGIIGNLNSPDGRSVSFTVPASLSGYGYQPVQLGTYQVSVTNNSGAASNALPFTVTSTSASNVAPSITNVSGPTSLAVNTQGTWSITVNNPSNSYGSVSVNWGDAGTYAAQSAVQNFSLTSQTFTFTHAYTASGSYTVTFTVSNSSGQSNTSSVTVAVSGSGGTGSVYLSSITPQSGPVGTQVILQGSGFTTDNTVHFGGGGTQHLYSSNGTQLYFTIPSYLSPCDVQPAGTMCAQYIQQVTAGSYQLFVTNANGTSGTLTFQVQ
jgi:hypothetical protein